MLKRYNKLDNKKKKLFMNIIKKPEILAPAGDTNSFLAAIAAGADAVYVGLKHFSARMKADNFSTSELAKMADFAKKEDRKLFIAFNSLVKPNDIHAALRLVKRLERDVKPHALIVQDIGMVEIAKEAGFSGELHFSTLSNLTHTRGLEVAKELGASRAILPREISIDEIRDIATKCPDNLDLELFVHGALCYCVSGRCYWSSYMGGKSGLRGRCVQPCRRVYTQAKRKGRFFSSLDLSLDVLTKTLLDIPQISSWKIEGRKKGAHYVYHTVSAYKMLRDHSNDNKAKKDASELIDMALGRARTHAKFLPQKNATITSFTEPTSSGMLIGHVQFAPPEKKQKTPSIPFIKPRMELKPSDYLRIGSEDEAWYSTFSVSKQVPKAGTLPLKLTGKRPPKPGVPVFLIDRKEKELQIIINDMVKDLARCKGKESSSNDTNFNFPLPKSMHFKKQANIHLRSSLPQGKETKSARSSSMGLWLSQSTLRAVSKTIVPRITWWLPPVIWQNEDEQFSRLVNEAIRKGAYNFVLNSPWQAEYFNDTNTNLIAGPFCNITNPASIITFKNLGFHAAIVSPELSSEEFLALPKQSVLPLGILVAGCFPMGLARHKLMGLKANENFQSPMREQFWARHYGQNLWIYPNWLLDITKHAPELEKAGYSFFVRMDEAYPHDLKLAERTSDFNWNNQLL